MLTTIDEQTRHTATRIGRSANGHLLMTLALIVAALASTATPARCAEPPRAKEGALGTVARRDESTPVPVPEPSPLAMQYYRSGNWLWGLSVLWDLLVPA